MLYTNTRNNTIKFLYSKVSKGKHFLTVSHSEIFFCWNIKKSRGSKPAALWAAQNKKLTFHIPVNKEYVKFEHFVNKVSTVCVISSLDYVCMNLLTCRVDGMMAVAWWQDHCSRCFNTGNRLTTKCAKPAMCNKTSGQFSDACLWH